jgi:hypothetical protein
MLKMSLLVLGLAAGAFAFTYAAPVSAAPKAGATCSTSWWEACNKRCISRGGKSRGCPEYCRRQQRSKGCNV